MGFRFLQSFDNGETLAELLRRVPPHAGGAPIPCLIRCVLAGRRDGAHCLGGQHGETLERGVWRVPLHAGGAPRLDQVRCVVAGRRLKYFSILSVI